MARKPRDDKRRKEPKYDLAGNISHVVANTRSAAVILQDHAVDEVTDDLGQEHNERIYDTLNQRERNHVAVNDVGNFMRQNRFNFFFRHRLQQPGGNSHQRRVFKCACRKSVGRALINGDFGHANIGLLRQSPDGFDQPVFGFIARTFDDLRTSAPFGHRFGD